MKYQKKLQLAAGAKVSMGTVEKWLKGGAVTEANHEALQRACSELGLERENEDPRRSGDDG